MTCVSPFPTPCPFSTRKPDEFCSHINAYAHLLFKDKWKWGPEHLPQLRFRNSPTNATSTPSDEVNKWFNGLNQKEKMSATVISQPKFFNAFIRSFNKKCLFECQFNLFSGKILPKVTQKVSENRKTLQSFNKLVSQMRVAWTSEPALYVSEGAFLSRQLLPWLAQVSEKQAFQHFSKLTDRFNPEENLLWFNSDSYHLMECWLASQIEKSIVKSYLQTGRDRLGHINRFKEYLLKQGKRSQVKLLQMGLEEAQAKLLISSSGLPDIQAEEELFLEQVQHSIEQMAKNSAVKKKSRKRTKNKNKVNISLPEATFPLQQCAKNDNGSATRSQSKERNQIRQLDPPSPKSKLETTQECKNSYFDQKISEKVINSIPEKQRCEDEASTMNSITTKTVVPEDSLTGALENHNLENEHSQFIEETQQVVKDQQSSSNEQQISEVFELKKLKTQISKTVVEQVLANFIDLLSTQTNKLYRTKVNIFERIRILFALHSSDLSFVLFGSNALGLSLPSSDIDIMVLAGKCEHKSQIPETLQQMAHLLQQMCWVVSCEIHLTARVPVIKLEVDPCIPFEETRCLPYFQQLISPQIKNYLNQNPSERSTFIKVDISCSLKEGPNHAEGSTELVRYWINKYPVLQRIVPLIKHILAIHKFNQNFKGGIGSYCLFVMVTAFLREFCLNNNINEGELFMKILQFYGKDFKNSQHTICLREKGSCFLPVEEAFKTSDISQQILASNPLRILDPVNGRLMSSSCYLFETIKCEFKRIHNELAAKAQLAGLQASLTVSIREARMMLSNKKQQQRWVHRFLLRNKFSFKELIEG